MLQRVQLYTKRAQKPLELHFTATFRTVNTYHLCIPALINHHDGSTSSLSPADRGHEKSHRQKLKARRRSVGSPQTAREREKDGTEPFDNKTGRLQEASY